MSRRSTSLSLVVVAFALFAAACSSESGSATTTITSGATTTSEASTTSEAPAPEVTTTSEADPVEADNGSQFVVSAVAFGAGGYVEITNVGDATGSLDGYWLCQRPFYQQLSGDLAPGETLRIDAATGAYGSLDVAAGEMGLYTSRDFGNPDAIVAYVAWGGTGGGRFGTAVAGGVWTDGSSVDATGASLISTSEEAPISAEGWSAG